MIRMEMDIMGMVDNCQHCFTKDETRYGDMQRYSFLGSIYTFHEACAKDVKKQVNLLLWFEPAMIKIEERITD